MLPNSICSRERCVVSLFASVVILATVYFFIAVYRSPSNAMDTVYLQTIAPHGSLFSIANFRQRWENSSSPATCERETFSLRQLHKCVQQSRQWTRFHKPMKVVLVGDSRAGLLRLQSPALFGFEKRGLCANMGLDDYDPYLKCTFEVLGIRGRGRHGGRVFHQTLTEGDDYFEFQSFWQKYMDLSFRAKLQDLIDKCRSSEDGCPAMVVANDGLWYARRFSLTINETATDWLLKYRNDLLDARESISQLARHTPVVWKLDESEIVSRQDQKFSILTPSVSVLHAYAYNILHGIPNVYVWSSLLPTAVDFYHHVCLLAYRSHNVLPLNIMHSACDDRHHVRYTVVSQYIHTVLTHLCRSSSSGRQSNSLCYDS